MLAHCFRSTVQKALAIFALALAACITVFIEPVQVNSDAHQQTMKVQECSDPKAQACHQAATAAAVAVANVQETQLRGQAVADERWEALKSADRDMQSACGKIPK